MQCCWITQNMSCSDSREDLDWRSAEGYIIGVNWGQFKRKTKIPLSAKTISSLQNKHSWVQRCVKCNCCLDVSQQWSLNYSTVEHFWPVVLSISILLCFIPHQRKILYFHTTTRIWPRQLSGTLQLQSLHGHIQQCLSTPSCSEVLTGWKSKKKMPDFCAFGSFSKINSKTKKQEITFHRWQVVLQILLLQTCWVWYITTSSPSFKLTWSCDCPDTKFR